MGLTLRLQLHRTCVEAEGYLELAMPEHALRTLQRRGHLVHGDARACYLLGEALRELERYRDAIYPLRRSLELVPDDTRVCLALGWCYKRIGSLDDRDRRPRTCGAHRVGRCAASLQSGVLLLRWLTIAGGRCQHLANALEIDGNFRELVADERDFDPIRSDPLFQSLTGVTN